MPTPLDPSRLIGATHTPPVAPKPTSVGGCSDGQAKTFDQVLGDFVKQADATQQEYDKAIVAVERGDTDNLHRVMIAQSQAQLSMKLAAEVRNKLVEAYKEVMRTQF
jgi:flagellar hook-basal body complex protein FliE